MKSKKQKKHLKKFRKAGSKMGRKVQKVKAAKKVVKEKEDVFAGEDTPINADDAFVSQPSYDEVRNVAEQFDGYKEWARESRGNNLTFGDY